ncbi:hypothetical protein [Thermobrachium celere]|uniref:hypothetical protein n=1 Tax=Thermobrachium celere TaxID=53422 RepID=UPI00194175C8|nr:hypothetical protein [Thermobrachium celere]GFR35466.1 hypothetical protein TCEA9_12780 [Thermobrachium celere]
MNKANNKVYILTFLLLFVVVVLATNVILNNESKKVSKEFLNTYYNIQDVKILKSKDIKELKEALTKKYEGILTEEALEKLAASRWILEGEKAADDFKCTLEIKNIQLKQDINSNDAKSYDYTVNLIVKYPDGMKKQISQSGTLKLIKINNKWIINSVNVREGELYKLMKK